MKKSDFKPKVWENAMVEARSVLIERAKAGDLISYSDLDKEINAIKFDMEQVDNRQVLGQVIGELSIQEDRAGRGMISAIVVHKVDHVPGDGFYSFAEELGRDISDKQVCWITEVKKVHESWQRK